LRSACTLTLLQVVRAGSRPWAESANFALFVAAGNEYARGSERSQAAGSQVLVPGPANDGITEARGDVPRRLIGAAPKLDRHGASSRAAMTWH